jgi:trehalose 6-phosphate phosphatase
VIHILAAEHDELLAQLARSRVLLAFDFDGTLAPIVPDREVAHMRARTRTLLSAACELYPCAVISGRSLRDVTARVEGVGVKHVIGNHGIEPGIDVARFGRTVERIRPALARELTHVSGIEIEDKQYSLSIHYRRVPDKRAARDAIEAAVSRLPHPLRLIPGKQVTSVIPIGARNKGDVLLELRERGAAEVALYVGDDVTDEDVFTLDQPGRLVGVRIGKSERSAARFYLRDQREIDSLLARMVRQRRQR